MRLKHRDTYSELKSHIHRFGFFFNCIVVFRLSREPNLYFVITVSSFVLSKCMPVTEAHCSDNANINLNYLNACIFNCINGTKKIVIINSTSKVVDKFKYLRIILVNHNRIQNKISVARLSKAFVIQVEVIES